MLERADAFDFSDLAGETGPPPLVPDAIGRLAVLHFSGESGGGGNQNPRPSDVARQQLNNEAAAAALRCRLAETAQKEAPQRQQGQ